MACGRDDGYVFIYISHTGGVCKGRNRGSFWGPFQPTLLCWLFCLVLNRQVIGSVPARPQLSALRRYLPFAQVLLSRWSLLPWTFTHGDGMLIHFPMFAKVVSYCIYYVVFYLFVYFVFYLFIYLLRILFIYLSRILPIILNTCIYVFYVLLCRRSCEGACC